MTDENQNPTPPADPADPADPNGTSTPVDQETEMGSEAKKSQPNNYG